MKEYEFEAGQDDKGIRLDILASRFLSKEDGVSRTVVQGLIKAGLVNVNGIHQKPNYKVKTGDRIIIKFEEKKETALEPEDIPLEIIHQDGDIAVINKPAGLVTHPAPGNYRHTLVNALLFHIGELSNVNPLRPGIVHRLDKDTSGLLVIAKNNQAHLFLARQFSDHTIKRRYIALVKGRVEFSEGVIELPIRRHPLKRESMSVGYGQEARYARTRYRVLKRFKDYTFLELEPFTGRTHQLRVHLLSLGHPILGDVKYGRKNGLDRLFLHAFSLGFVHPKTLKFVEFKSDIPPEFEKFLSALR